MTTFRRAIGGWKGALAILVLVVICTLALGAPVLTKVPPNQMQLDRMLPPQKDWLLGTDVWGRDIFSRISYGARTSLLVGVLSASLAMLLGSAIGVVAGYYRGTAVDVVLMRVLDFLLSFPSMVLAIIAVTFVGSSIWVVMLVIGAMGIPVFGRIAYSSTRSVRELDFITAAQAVGAPVHRILLRGILPSILAPLLVQFSLQVGHAMLIEAGLSFVGLGPPPPTVSWGQMVRQAVANLPLGVLPLVWPSLFLSLTILAFNVAGDVLRDTLDPYLRGRK